MIRFFGAPLPLSVTLKWLFNLHSITVTLLVTWRHIRMFPSTAIGAIHKWCHANLTQNSPPSPLCHTKLAILPTKLNTVSQKHLPPCPYLPDVIHECPLMQTCVHWVLRLYPAVLSARAENELLELKIFLYSLDIKLTSEKKWILRVFEKKL